MDRPRLRRVSNRLVASFVLTSLVACAGTNAAAPTLPTPTPIAAATPTAAPSSTPGPVTVSAVSAAAQALPALGGGTTTVALAVAPGTPANATVAITASNAPPAGTIAIAANGRTPRALTRVPLVYYTFVPSVDIQLTSFPSFTISYPTTYLPAGTTIKEAFLDAGTSQPVFTYDIAFGASGATFTATANAPKLLAGKSYIFAFYYESGSTATATPSPAPSSSAASTATPTPTPAATATASPLSTPTPTAKPSTAPSATPTPNPSATPTPVPTMAGFPSGSATFSAPVGYNGSTAAIVPLVTTESGGNGNATFESVQQNAPSIQQATLANPLRQIVLEINDNVKLGNSSTYTLGGSNFGSILTYAEYYATGSTFASRNWIAIGGTVTFENVGNGVATYRVRGATFKPDPNYTTILATGTFTLDAVGTANPYTSN